MDAQPISRFAGEELDAGDLRWIVSVDEVELVEDGWANTVVGLDDGVSSYADLFDDGLEDALADQPGIDAVEHGDREVLSVRSELSLPDVHAAAIRALLAINQAPRRVRRNRPLRRAVMSSLADGVAGTLADYGFVGRLRMSREQGGTLDDPDDRHGPGFYRVFPDDRLVQMVGLRDGFGLHADDGTIVCASLRLSIAVFEVATNDVLESIEVQHGYEVVACDRVLSHVVYDVPATIDGIERAFLRDALPLCESTTSRAAIVNRWVHGLPWSVPDSPSWEAADTAARWGFRKHARDLLRCDRRLSQSAVVAAKHGL